MAEDVVDVLEPIEVHEQHGDVAALVFSLAQRERGLLVETRAVDELGERIVRRLVLVAPQLRLQPSRCAEHDAEQRGPQQDQSRDEQHPEPQHVVVDPRGDRRIRQIDLERPRGRGARGELDRRVDLEQLVVGAVILCVLGTRERAHLRSRLASQRLGELVAGREAVTDEARVVGVHHADVAVPDLDARHITPEEPGAQRAIERDHLRLREAVGELRRSEARLHAEPRHEHRGLAATREVAILDAGLDAPGEHDSERDDQHRAQDGEPRYET